MPRQDDNESHAIIEGNSMSQPYQEQPPTPPASGPGQPEWQAAMSPQPPAPYVQTSSGQAHPGPPSAPQYQPAQQTGHNQMYNPGQPAQPPYPGQGQHQQPYPHMSQQPPMQNAAHGYPQPKSKLLAGLLGIFLGGLGIHRFYLGYTLIGILQIAATLVLGGFTFGLTALWGLVEGIMILAGASYFQRDAKGSPLRD
jgi:TM2 domain-containing membrane protein YozV